MNILSRNESVKDEMYYIEIQKSTDFPYGEILVVLTAEPSDNINVGGHALRSGTIPPEIGFHINYNLKEIDKLKIEVKKAIRHELLHIYQGYTHHKVNPNKYENDLSASFSGGVARALQIESGLSKKFPILANFLFCFYAVSSKFEESSYLAEIDKVSD